MITAKGFSGMADDVAYLMASVISLAFSLSIGGLFAIHTYMLLNNMTTLEMSGLSRRNAFDHGDWRENWGQTFGKEWKTWFLPIPPRDRENLYDGFNTKVVPSF
jgi:hypothetical protein